MRGLDSGPLVQPKSGAPGCLAYEVRSRCTITAALAEWRERWGGVNSTVVVLPEIDQRWQTLRAVLAHLGPERIFTSPGGAQRRLHDFAACPAGRHRTTWTVLGPDVLSRQVAGHPPSLIVAAHACATAPTRGVYRHDFAGATGGLSQLGFIVPHIGAPHLHPGDCRVREVDPAPPLPRPAGREPQGDLPADLVRKVASNASGPLARTIMRAPLDMGALLDIALRAPQDRLGEAEDGLPARWPRPRIRHGTEPLEPLPALWDDNTSCFFFYWVTSDWVSSSGRVGW